MLFFPEVRKTPKLAFSQTPLLNAKENKWEGQKKIFLNCQTLPISQVSLLLEAERKIRTDLYFY